MSHHDSRDPDASGPDSDPSEDFDPDAYLGTQGTIPRELDVASDDNPLTEALGDEAHREFKYDPRTTGERFAFRYDEPVAAFREYLANAETACARRARLELRACGYDPLNDGYESIEAIPKRELFAIAEREAGYRAIIETFHSHHESNLPAFQIRDNGIGISIEEFQALRRIGLSASHDNPRLLGEFGQGLLAGFTVVGKNGDIECVTASRQDGASYGFRMRIDGTNDLDETREHYGTTFTFPAFAYEHRGELDVRDAIEEYSSGLTVPVLYREYGADGLESYNEEYSPSSITDRYDGTPVVWEDDNEYVTAVMWPTVSDHRNRTSETYLISMPIERNDKGHSTKKYNAPFYWDLQLNVEDGRVLHSPVESQVGQIPIDPMGYDELDADEREAYVSKADLHEDAVVLPEPVDDRDRLKSGYDDFFEYVSQQLAEEFIEAVRPDFEALASEGISYLQSMNSNDGSLFATAFDRYKPNFDTIRPRHIQSAYEDRFGVTFDDDVAEELAAGLSTIEHAPRNASNVTKKRNRQELTVVEFLSKYDGSGDVFMSARTVSSTDKAQLAWELDEDNVVVVVGSASRYDRFESQFGWRKLKELTLYGIADEYPDLDPDVAARLERGSIREDTPGDSEPADYTERTRPVSVRTLDTMHRMSAGSLYDRLDAGDLELDGESIDRLLVYRATDGHTASSGDKYTNRLNGIARVVVPNYVAEFLGELDCVLEDPSVIDREQADQELMVAPTDQFTGSRGDLLDRLAACDSGRSKYGA